MFEFYVGDAMENNYNSLLNELYIFYNRIKNYILLYFEEKIEKSSLEIDFYKDFIISNDFTNGFVKYDNEKNKFLLSIPNGLTKYNSIKSTKPLKLISVEDKMQSQYYSSFTIDELFSNLSRFKYKKILQFEEKEFEKKYNLKINSLNDEKNNYISSKPLNPKKELINLLKTTKNRYLKNKNVVSNSYGFVTITTFIFGVFITFVVAFLVLYLLFRR